MNQEVLEQVIKNGGKVWFVVEQEVMPLIEPPSPEDGEHHAVFTLFTTPEGAEDFKEYAIERLEAHPSQFKVVSKPLDEVWESIDELCTFAKEEYDAKFAIRLADLQIEKKIIKFDTIYKQDELAN